MARYVFQGVFTDQSGNAIEGGTVTPYLTGTSTAADVYAAASGGAAVNSVETNSAGKFVFYVDAGTYGPEQLFDITLSKTNFTDQTYPNVRIRQGFTGGSASEPSCAFGDGDTGFYESADGTLQVVIEGAEKFNFVLNRFDSRTANGPQLANEASTSTNPVFSNISDTDTGFGFPSDVKADACSMIAGGLEAVRAEDPADLAASGGAGDETSLWLYDKDAGTMVQVTVGADDSGGAGFKYLRIPN